MLAELVLFSVPNAIINYLIYFLKRWNLWLAWILNKNYLSDPA